MLLLCLTGGIGSGKSTLARMLEGRGAVVFDADELARRALAPGTPGFRQTVERFGESIKTKTGQLDREVLARRVFADPSAREDLEAIVHPEVFRLLSEGLRSYRHSDRVVVFDAPLIVESRFHPACDLVVVVTAPVEVRVRRVMAARGLTESAVRARIEAQASDEERLSVAHVSIQNDGTLEELGREVERLWGELVARAKKG